MPNSRRVAGRSTGGGALSRQLCGTTGGGASGDSGERGASLNGPGGIGGVSQPKHAHVPHIPVEGELSFALLAFLFSVTSMALQYLHLYKTVWWLPHSHAEYAINFYLIDQHLVGYLFAMELLPFIHTFFKQVRELRSRRCCYWLSVLFLSLIAIAWSVSFLYVSYHVYVKTSGLYIVLLLYPCITYAMVFYSHLPGQIVGRLRRAWLTDDGMNGISPSSLSNSDSPGGTSELNSCPTTPSPLPGAGAPVRGQSVTPASSPSHSVSAARNIGCLDAWRTAAPHHNCSSNPEDIRDEAETLKADFNRRLRVILFSTLFSFFHASLVPLLFIQMLDADCESCWNIVHYDGTWCGQHVAVSALSAFLLNAVHHLPPTYIDTLHQCALHLGRWHREEGRNAHVPYNAWSELQVWPQGALVKHVKGLFRAEGINNAAEPGNTMHSRFFFIFYPPLRLVNYLSLLVFILIIYQFAVLVHSYEWYKMISATLMLFFNFYTLYKIFRNKILLGRCYKDELSTKAHPD